MEVIKVSEGLVYYINKKPFYQLRLTIIQCVSVIFDMNQFIKADYYSNFISMYYTGTRRSVIL